MGYWRIDAPKLHNADILCRCIEENSDGKSKIALLIYFERAGQRIISDGHILRLMQGADTGLA